MGVVTVGHSPSDSPAELSALGQLYKIGWGLLSKRATGEGEEGMRLERMGIRENEKNKGK